MSASTRASSTFPPRSAWLVSLSALGLFLLVDRFEPWLFTRSGSELEGWPRVGALVLLKYTWYWLPPLLLAALFWGWRRAPAALGLAGPIGLGFGVGLTGTLPLAVGFALLLPFDPPATLATDAVRFALLPGVFEEVLYRGLLFGFLFRFAGWGFLPAALSGAVLFGAAHAWQGGDWAETLGIVAITGIGGFWFSWLYVEWRFNLWVPVAFHVLMNFYWELFSVSATALGPWEATGLRLLVIAFSVVLTVACAHRQGGRVVRGSVWWQPRSVPSTS